MHSPQPGRRTALFKAAITYTLELMRSLHIILQAKEEADTQG